MNKLSIKGVLCESVNTWRHSLWDLFKNNWLWIICNLIIYPVLGLQLIGHEATLNQMPEIQEIMTHLSLWSMIPIPMFVVSIFAFLLMFMVYGYAFKYVVNKDKNATGLGGVYLNAALFKMIISQFLTMLILWIVGIALMLGFMLLFMGVGSLGAMTTMMTNQAWPMAGMGISAVIGVIAALSLMIYISARFNTVSPYSYLHNKIAVFEPFAQTKSNVFNIIMINILMFLIMLLIWLGFSVVLGLVSFGFVMLSALMPMLLITTPFMITLGIIVYLLGNVAFMYLMLVTQAVIYKRLSEM